MSDISSFTDFNSDLREEDRESILDDTFIQYSCIMLLISLADTVDADADADTDSDAGGDSGGDCRACLLGARVVTFGLKRTGWFSSLLPFLGRWLIHNGHSQVETSMFSVPDEVLMQSMW